jgi:hypothetical protein
MTKITLYTKLKALFEEQKWQLEIISRLPAAFVRSTDVTAFFQPRVLRRSEHLYLIDGYVGVVNREFESDWIRSNLRPRNSNTHCLAMNIANIDPIRAEQYINTMDMETQILAFTTSTTHFLETLPNDAARLLEALERGKLADIPLEKFAIHGRDRKLAELVSYIKQLQENSHGGMVSLSGAPN